LSQSTQWTIPLEHPAFAGHFIGMPILPGVVLLDIAIKIFSDANQIDPSHYKISSVKFLSPAKPGETLTFEQSISNKGALNFNILASDRKIATGTIMPASSL
jgi:3-hydroxyacyl-[acyl-carrier-protein] dehydratase